MPWAILPWLALVEFLGLTAKEHDKHVSMTTSDNVDDDGDSDHNDTDDNDGGDGDNDDGEVERDGGDDDNDDNDNDDDVNIDIVEDDDDHEMTTMRWRRGRMDDNDAMAMGGQ